MNDKKKLKLILIIAIVSILTILGVTYAFFNYSRTGENNKLIAGEVYLRYIETNQMTLNNAIPETKTSALQKNDNIFYFKIEGKNTSPTDIFYDIIISHGDSQTGKSRLEDNHIRIYLERDGVTLIDGEIFDDWDNPVIYTDKMPALTNSHTVFNYELRMWVDEDVTISDTDPTADYDTATWNNSYASLKLHVNSGGVFENAQPASCFTYDVVDEVDTSKTVEYAKPIITYNFSAENVAKCQEFSMNFFGSADRSDAQDGYQSFCSGAGTINGISIETGLAGGGFGSIDEVAPEIGVVENYTIEKQYYELNTSEESINVCSNYVAGNTDDSSQYIDFCSGTGVGPNGKNIYEEFEIAPVSVKNDLVNLNVFTPVTDISEVSEEIRILEYDYDCGPDVSIPSYIDGLPVTTIGYMDETTYQEEVGELSYAFSNKDLNTVKLPSTLKYIGRVTFNFNNLTNVVIPSSVVAIDDYAFSYNSITDLTISEGVVSIGESAFSDNSITDLTIPSSVITIKLSAFSVNPLVNVNVQGSPSLGSHSFNNSNKSTFLSFSYGGTCSELQSYFNIFGKFIPQTIITSDSNSCAYSG